MSSRLAEIVLSNIESTLEDLEIPDEDKAVIEFELVPFLSPRAPALVGAPPEVGIAYLVGIALPTLAGDHIMPLLPLEDPHDQHEVRRVTLQLYDQAKNAVDAADAKTRATANGHKTSPGGLAIP